MKKTTFIYLFFLMNVFLIFINIYQHNLVIKTHYEKQKIVRKKNKLLLKKDLMLMELFKQKQPSVIEKYAQENFKFEKTKHSQLKNLPLSTTNLV
jgi:hypothetical protein